MENGNCNVAEKATKVVGNVAAGTFVLGALFWQLLLWIVGLSAAASVTYLGWVLIGRGFWRTALGVVFLLGGGSYLLSSLFRVISLIYMLIVGIVSSLKKED